MNSRVLLVALDALEQSWFKRLLDEGRLPNLAAFIAESSAVDVSSDGATLHGTLWPTFAAGRGPGHHGRYFWNQWSSEEMKHIRNDAAELSF